MVAITWTSVGVQAVGHGASSKAGCRQTGGCFSRAPSSDTAARSTAAAPGSAARLSPARRAWVAKGAVVGVHSFGESPPPLEGMVVRVLLARGAARGAAAGVFACKELVGEWDLHHFGESSHMSP